MQKTYKLKIQLLFLLLVCGFSSFAQNNTSSPYSRYGYGDMVSLGKGRSAGIGGTGIALSSKLMLNTVNPAAYGALDSMSFLYEVGLRANFTEFSVKSSSLKHNERDVNIDYFSMAWPVTRWWRMGLGVIPKSNVGYEYMFEVPGDDKMGNVDTYQTFNGKGGINKFNLTQAFIPFDNFYLGVNVSYMFGQIENSCSVYTEDFQAKSFYNNKTLTVKDLMFDFGAQYKFDLSKNNTMTLGAVFNAKKSIKTDLDLLTTMQDVKGRQNVITNNTIRSSFDYPMSWGLGMAYEYKDKLMFAADYEKSLWSKTDFWDEEIKFNDNTRISAGLEYTPDKGAIRNYLNVITYRFGAYYNDTYLPSNLLGKKINDYGFTVGCSLPLRRSVTNINVALTMGQRGTTENSLIKERYARLSVSFSMFSRWFYKQKYK